MSTSVVTNDLYTPDDLLSMPDGKGIELVRGRLLEHTMGAESSWVGGRLFGRLDRFVEEHDSGWLFPAETGYQCFPHDPTMVRKPDLSFIRKDRLPQSTVPTGWITIPPDLAVEVVSPNDRASELEDKLADYRLAGIPLVWVIYPDSRSVLVHRRDGTLARLLETNSLAGEDILPGFACPIREILPAPTAVRSRRGGSGGQPPSDG
ncbi:Uma2 family endonuclease [Aquisphaera insulae]|uniref:Uma2 family endonuclease n=1 Tax=Aquisphaera insulae TaxID=2712864 RepID=UPI00211070C0|nr:Uma2 family endonuclease [Aquisphaera insulae]